MGEIGKEPRNDSKPHCFPPFSAYEFPNQAHDAYAGTQTELCVTCRAPDPFLKWISRLGVEAFQSMPAYRQLGGKVSWIVDNNGPFLDCPSVYGLEPTVVWNNIVTTTELSFPPKQRL